MTQMTSIDQELPLCTSVMPNTYFLGFYERGLLFQRNDNFVGTIVFDIAAANIG